MLGRCSGTVFPAGGSISPPATRSRPLTKALLGCPLLSEEVTSIHPINLLAQARQCWWIGHTLPLLSGTGPPLERLLWQSECQGGRFFTRRSHPRQMHDEKNAGGNFPESRRKPMKEKQHPSLGTGAFLLFPVGCCCCSLDQRLVHHSEAALMP